MEVECAYVRINEVGGTKSAATRNMGNEWYLDHICGDVDSNGNVNASSVVQQPDRDDQAETGGSTNSFHPEYYFPQMVCKPNTAVAFATRGYEKDTVPPDTTEDYQPSFSEWMDLFKDFRKAISPPPGGVGRFVLDAAAMLIKAIISNDDDPMNPSMTLLSHGACRFIHEQCGGEIEFYRQKVYGLNTYMAKVDDGRDVQIASEDTGREYDIDYKIKVSSDQAPVVPGEYYQIIAKHSGKVWDVPSQEVSEKLIQNDSTGGNNQLFRFQQYEDTGYWSIIAKHSERRLREDRDSQRDPTYIIQENMSEDDGVSYNEQFQFVPKGDDYWQLFPRGYDEGYCVKVEGTSDNNGAKLTTCPPEEVNNATHFKFVPEPKPVEEGVWYRIEAKHSGKVLDVSGGSTADGANIDQWTFTGADNQLFGFKEAGNGWYSITAKHSRKALHASGDSHDEGTNVDQMTFTEGQNSELFKLGDAGGGYYSIISKKSGKALHVSGNSQADGANIEQSTFVKGNGQLFRFIPV